MNLKATKSYSQDSGDKGDKGFVISKYCDTAKSPEALRLLEGMKHDMDAMNISVNDIATLTGDSIKFISAIVEGVTIPNPALFARIAMLLNWEYTPDTTKLRLAFDKAKIYFTNLEAFRKGKALGDRVLPNEGKFPFIVGEKYAILQSIISIKYIGTKLKNFACVENRSCVFVFKGMQGDKYSFTSAKGGWSRTYSGAQLFEKYIIHVKNIHVLDYL